MDSERLREQKSLRIELKPITQKFLFSVWFMRVSIRNSLINYAKESDHETIVRGQKSCLAKTDSGIQKCDGLDDLMSLDDTNHLHF